MSRRRVAVKREILPDPKYKSKLLAKFINHLMVNGKKSLAERIVYQAFDLIEAKTKKDPLTFFEDVLSEIAPHVEVKSRRIGGATYQVPVEVRFERRLVLGMRWVIDSSKKRSEKSMPEKLCGEVMDASQGRGNTIKKRDDTHKMAEANKAFSHYRL